MSTLLHNSHEPAHRAPREAVVLCGMTAGERKAAEEWLKRRGHRVVSTPRAASMAVVSDGLGADELEHLASMTGGVTTLREMKAVEAATSAEDTSEMAPEIPNETEPLLHVGGERVRVAEIVLERRAGDAGPLVPPAAAFGHLVMDRHLAAAMRAVALGVVHGRPVAIEGETAAAKTTAVLYLAHLLRQPVRRVNLNGATDAGELVGRFAPAPNGGFHFIESALPLAMRHGDWVLLDEINLAEAQCIERLNPALESPPTLILTEHDGTVFGPGGVAIDPRFHVIATFNPAAYAGRNALSPALRSRFHMHCARPPEMNEDLHLLRRLVHGEQPAITVAGKNYGSIVCEPVHPALQKWPKADRMLAALAKFHNHCARAAGQGGEGACLGTGRAERYCFNRRTLLFAVSMLERAFRAGTAPDRALRAVVADAYIAQTDSEADERAIVRMAEAASLLCRWKEAA